MKRRYNIVGTTKINDIVRLSLKPEDLVTEKQEEMGIMQMAKNITAVQQKMQKEAMLNQMPDVVSIPYDEYLEHQYKIDDIVWIEVSPEV